MTNCPNCSAILSYDGGLHCDYCGARFERPERLVEEVVFYADGAPYYSTTRGLLDRGFLSANEARQLMSSDYPSPANLETR